MINKTKDKINQKSMTKRPSTVPSDLIAEKLHEFKGNVRLVAKDLSILYLELTHMIDHKVELQNIVLAYREDLLDLAEEKLRSAIEDGDLKAVTFALKTLGRNRGYVTKTEVLRETRVSDGDKIDLSNLSVAQLKDLQKLYKDAGIVIDEDGNPVA